MNEELRNELECELRKIYDDDDFVICIVAAILNNDDNARTMLGYFGAARNAGNDVTHDEALSLALVIKRRSNLTCI